MLQYLSIDPIACILGLIAIYLAWKAYVASTRYSLRIATVSSCVRCTVENPNGRPELQVTVQNRGIPLTAPSVILRFRDIHEDGYTRNWRLEALEVDAEKSPLPSGASGAYVLRMHKKSQGLSHSFPEITHPRRQKLSIVINDRGHEVAVIRLFHWTDRFVEWYREKAAEVNLKFMEFSDDASGRTMARYGWLHFPELEMRESTACLRFTEYCKDLSRSQPNDR